MCLLLGGVLLSCKKDTINPEPEKDVMISDFIRKNYLNDARNLYLFEILQDPTHPNYNKVTLAEDEVNQILARIQYVYDLKTPERDLVFEEHKIHSQYCFSFKSLVLKVDATAPEIQKLSQGVIPTGNDQLDKLLDTYDFNTAEALRSYPDFPWVLISSTNIYNLIPLEKAFSQVSSIDIAEFNKFCVGGDNQMFLTRHPDGSSTLEFERGWGDCPSGCINSESWKFEIPKLNVVN